MSPFALLVEQLWAPAIADGTARVDIRRAWDDAADPQWEAAEEFWLMPDAERASLLLPVAPARVTSAAATHYRGMRRPTRNAGRTALGLAARVGLPLSSSRVAVSVRRDDPHARSRLPLSILADALGVDRLYASMGVRAGANRKATLSLISAEGEPLGYAKMGWSPATDSFVRAEAAALRRVGGRPGPMRAPAVLAELDYYGHAVVVTEPLPLGSRGSRDARVAAPTSQELYALCRIHRKAALADTSHFQALASRLAGLASDPVGGAVARAASSLVTELAREPAELPVTEMWHGDLTPWNRARDANGQLWVWDWESAEVDAVAGLDALHWAFNVRRVPSGRLTDVDLRATLDDAAVHLVAAGVPRAHWSDVAAVYVLTVVERATELASRAGDWGWVWIRPDELLLLLRQANALRESAELR